MLRASIAAGALLLAAGGYAAVQRRLRVQREEYAALVAGLAAPERYRDAALVLVVDVGSSSIRASCYALVDAATGRALGRRPCAAARAAVEWVMLQGSLTQLPMNAVINAAGEAALDQIERAVESVIDRTLEFVRAAGLAGQLRGVGFSTFAMNLVGVDAKGAPVTPVYTVRSRARCSGRRPSTALYARRLRELLAEKGALDDCHDRTGAMIHPAYASAEFFRLHHEEPNTVARVHRWQSITSYLFRKWMLAGDRPLPMSFTEASWTGLLDVRRGVWDGPLLELVGMPLDKMPDVQDSRVPVSGLRPSFARRWTELADVPFFLGIGDGAAANVGSKCVDSSRIAVTIGTSAALRVVLGDDALERRRVPKGLWCYRIGDSRVLLGGALNDGGSVFQFFCQTLQLRPEDADTELRKLRPAQHGLCVLPFLSGERAPGWRDDATCAITGINKWTKPLHLLQAAMESVATRLALVFALVAEYADSDATIIASGTALTSSRAWRQMLADNIGRELVLETCATEATSRGVAVFLGSYLGLHTLEETATLPDDKDAFDRSHPNVGAHAAYLEARRQQETLYRKLFDDC
ncbi:hypothetical protein P43SY_009897 [Pythium insidiosum]|uniref:Gluconokinase n=1 Tax=Pythium insidiosum TaxID=114742 RepID=A0AAD5LJP2_PYTIN|nr:hypothetical protein P43SY_009897 [Pythium insidiosum]